MGILGKADGGQATLKAEAERIVRAETGVYYRVALERFTSMSTTTSSHTANQSTDRLPP